MKFNCLTPRQRAEKSEIWKHWFAWYPIKMGPNDCRWLETIQRRPTYYYFKRFPNNTPLFCGYIYKELYD